MGKFLLPEFTQIKVPSPNRVKIVSSNSLFDLIRILICAWGGKKGKLHPGLGLKALILARELKQAGVPGQGKKHVLSGSQQEIGKAAGGSSTKAVRLIVPTCMGHKGYTFAKLTAPA
ncbi:hypothetical protein IFM89_014572, partial [Coptis chinensis]